MPGSVGRSVVVPTKLAALAAGVPEATIRKWASRGKLTRHGRPGRAEYDLDELYELGLKARARSGGTPDQEHEEAIPESDVRSRPPRPAGSARQRGRA